jgi:hypothetical protein
MSKVAFRKRALSSFFWLYLFKKLPLAFLAGVKVNKLDDVQCDTLIRFRWINQNPFKSIYFAAMHMAAELSTGLLLIQHMNRDTRFSMLLVETSARFEKKAVGRVLFNCPKAKEVEKHIASVMNNSEGYTIVLPVTATNSKGENVAYFNYTWSCKKRSA